MKKAARREREREGERRRRRGVVKRGMIIIELSERRLMTVVTLPMPGSQEKPPDAIVMIPRVTRWRW